MGIEIRNLFNKKKSVLLWLFALALIADMLWALFWFPNYFKSSITTVETGVDIPRIALVLGSSVTKNGQPNLTLEQRLQTALTLYQNHQIDILLLSGDGRSRYYDETKVMKAWMMKQGLAEEALWVDPYGLRTSESIRRAKEVYGISAMTIVTSASHLPRSMYLANMHSIRSVGIASPPRTGLRNFYDRVYEYAAIHRALWDRFVFYINAKK